MKNKIFKWLYIRQEKQYEDPYGTWIKFRINPFNPLTYVVMILGLLMGLFLFGPVGMWREIDSTNVFKWNEYQISEKQFKQQENETPTN
jgi:hypothetical protein